MFYLVIALVVIAVATAVCLFMYGAAKREKAFLELTRQPNAYRNWDIGSMVSSGPSCSGGSSCGGGGGD